MIFKNKTYWAAAIFFATITVVSASINTEEEPPQYSWSIKTKAGVVKTIDRPDNTKAVNFGCMTCGSLSVTAPSLNGVLLLAPLHLTPSMTLEEATAALRASGLID